MVDYNVQVDNTDYTIEENAKLSVAQEAMILWILTMDGVLPCRDQRHCYEVGPVLCQIYARCLMRSASQVKLVHLNRSLSQSPRIPLSLHDGDPGDNPTSNQILGAKAVGRALNWSIHRADSRADNCATVSVKRARLLHILLKDLHSNLSRGKAGLALVGGENMGSGYTYVVDQNITDLPNEYKRKTKILLTDEVYENAYELLHVQQAIRIISSNFEFGANTLEAVVRAYSACIFRAAARVIRIKEDCSFGSFLHRPVSVQIGDPGTSPMLMHTLKARAVLRAAQWGPLGWEEIVTSNPENTVHVTRCISKLVRAIYLSPECP